MSKGCDCNTSVVGHIHDLKAAGIQWVGRYYGRTKQHPLTRAEAQAISSVDLWCVAVWESGYPTQPDYFSAAQGRLDGAYMVQEAQAVGQPHSSAIYVAVDYDAAAHDLTVIESYFEAVRQHVRPDYLLGVYSDGFICQRLLKAGIVGKTWLARPPAWTGYDKTTRYNIRQTQNGVMLCGLLVDLDTSDGNAGGFQVS